MAPSAFEAAPNRSINTRFSSPTDFATATGTSFRDALHSTPQRDNSHFQQNFPDRGGQNPSEGSSDFGSAEMSIEIGRGGRHVARDEHRDFSSNNAFSFVLDDNNQYEIGGDSPVNLRPKSYQHKSGGLDAGKSRRSVSGPKQRTSDAARHSARGIALDEQNVGKGAGNGAKRTSRFTSLGPSFPTRFAADHGLQGNPRHAVVTNATIQSTTYSANHSFMLPDLPNLTELVSDVRKDPTSGAPPNMKSRSRFASAHLAAGPQAHRVVEAIDIPDEEKAIFASLQLLKDKVSQLEMEKAEAQRQAEEYENQVIDLQSRLRSGGARVDSARVSEDEALEYGKSNLRTTIQTLKDRLARSESKFKTANKETNQLTKQRDNLIVEISAAYFKNEELLNENEILSESQEMLRTEHDELKSHLDAIRAENEQLRATITGTKGHRLDADARNGRLPASKSVKNAGIATDGGQVVHRIRPNENARVGRKEKEAGPVKHSADRNSHRVSDLNPVLDIASRIEQEVQRHRDEAAARNQIGAPGSKGSRRRSISARRRSTSQQRQDGTAHARTSSKSTRQLPTQMGQDVSDAESTTDLNFTAKSRTLSRAQVTQSRVPTQLLTKSQDMTLLSDLDDDVVANLRRKLEEELRARHLQKRVPTSAPKELETTSSKHQSLPRKSSLRDVTGAIDDGTGRISLGGNVQISKTVRVQSPQVSLDASQDQHEENQTGELSITSNTSRRRRRAVSANSGETSEFIIPDITLHRSHSLPANLTKSCIQHNAAECTLCAPSSQKVNIPMPTSVNDRENGPGDSTEATVRPSQPPSVALATVLKHLEDEVAHLKIRREAQNRLYNRHDPALSKRRRVRVKTALDSLTAEIEKRSDQIYALYDVLEGQIAQAKATGDAVKEMGADEIEETLTSIGIDPAELSGRVGRQLPIGLEDEDEMSGAESDELPWEGLSDVESEEELPAINQSRRRSVAL